MRFVCYVGMHSTEVELLDDSTPSALLRSGGHGHGLSFD